MVGMSSYDDTLHPRHGDGKYAKKHNSSPSLALHDPPALSDEELDTAVRSAEAALLWASTAVEDARDENPDAEFELDEPSRKWLKDEITDFANAYPEMIQAARDTGLTSSEGDGFAGRFGYDFAMELDGQGTGFWDEPELGDLGKTLSFVIQRRGHGSLDQYADVYTEQVSIEQATNPYITGQRREAALQEWDRATGEGIRQDWPMPRVAAHAHGQLASKRLLQHLPYRNHRQLDNLLGYAPTEDRSRPSEKYHGTNPVAGTAPWLNEGFQQ